MTVTLNDLNYVRSHVRQVPDFPKKGILFLDITTATKDAEAFRISVEYLYELFKNEKLDYVAGIESRGFIFGAALAAALGIGFIPIRKPNKLPAETISETGDKTSLFCPLSFHVVRIESESLPTGILSPKSGHSSSPTALTVSKRAAS